MTTLAMSGALVPPLDRLEITRQAATPAASCAIWIHDRWPDLGVIGEFEATDRGSALSLLERACRELQAAGCTKAVGPMNGSTWRNYRLVTGGGNEPPFLLEPENPSSWPRWFADAGFRQVARYVSAIDRDIARTLSIPYPALDPRIDIRGVTPDSLAEDLGAVHGVVHDAFSKAPFFSPIGRDEFVEKYRLLEPLIDPDLVKIAERDGRVVGFVLAYPDHSATSGDRRAVVIKTIAVRPEAQGDRLGEHLTRACYAGALDSGYGRAIHALMHAGAASRHMTSGIASVFRTYALYGRGRLS